VVDSPKTASMFGQQRMDASSVSLLASMEGVEALETGTEAGAAGNGDGWERRAVNVYPDGLVTVREEHDSHGAVTVTVSVPEGAEPVKRVAFVREVNGKRAGLYVVDRETYRQLYDGYRERYGHDPELLPPGEFLRVANPELYQSANPVFVILFTPLVVAFFQFMVSRKKEITTARKIFLGLVLTTLSLLVMAGAGFLSDHGSLKVSGLWLISFYAIVTLGELCLSPMGLSLVTKLSPKRLVGLTMGGWFMATAFGNNFSGFFGSIQHQMNPTSFFLLLAGLAALGALFIFLLLPRMDAVLKKYGV